MDEILEKYKDVFDLLDRYSKWLEKRFTVKTRLERKLTKILKEEAERKGIKYDKIEFIKVKDEVGWLRFRKIVKMIKLRWCLEDDKVILFQSTDCLLRRMITLG